MYERGVVVWLGKQAASHFFFASPLTMPYFPSLLLLLSLTAFYALAPVLVASIHIDKPCT